MTSHNGFQRKPITPAGTVVPPGSNSQHLPRRLRATWVAANTSAFMLVDTTAPGAKATDGMITDWVFPDSGGPITNAAPARTGGDHLPAGIDAEIAAGHTGTDAGGAGVWRCAAARPAGLVVAEGCRVVGVSGGWPGRAAWGWLRRACCCWTK